MYYVLYDKDFNAIGKRKTYPCSSWTIKRRAFEFDEIMIEGLAIESTKDATYVGLHENHGELKIIAFSGIPQSKDGKTTINAIDVRHILNNDAVIDLTSTSINSVQALYVYLLSLLFNAYEALGIEAIIDTTELVENPLTFIPSALERTRALGNVWNTIQAVNALYDAYVEAHVNFDERVITLKVRPVAHIINIKLSDFNVQRQKYDQRGINRVACFNTAYIEQTLGASMTEYYLLKDNRVLTGTEALLPLNDPFILHPPRIKGFVHDDIEQSRAQGLVELYKNRYQSVIEIDVNGKTGYLLSPLWLNYKANIYGYQKDDPNAMIELPVMEITENQSGFKTIKFGRLEEYWWV
jgi:hypothetical protein